MSDVPSYFFSSVRLVDYLSDLDCLGYLASGCVLLTFCMQSMLRLRVIALLSNVAFMAYGWAGRLMPILVLHCMLLLVNSVSLVGQLKGSSKAGTREGPAAMPDSGPHEVDIGVHDHPGTTTHCLEREKRVLQAMLHS
jgi:hypothetical protein